MKRRSILLTLGAVAIALLGFLAGQWWTDDAGQGHSPSARESDAPLIGIASLNNDAYVLAVRQAGGIPIVLPKGDSSPERIAEYLELVDGLLMPGGADIPPSEWGEEPHSTTRLIDDDRYQFEKELITAWINDTDKPLLGICLGGQWVNVAHGGSLIQDIPSELGVNHRVPHSVILEPNSRLYEIFDLAELDVNSQHHQSVRDVGEGLKVTARSPDGVIEAIETTDPDRFLIGVQWHPETLVPEDSLQAKLFEAFVEAALQRSTGTSLATNKVSVP